MLIPAMVLWLAACTKITDVRTDYSLSGQSGNGLVAMSLTHTLQHATIVYQNKDGGSIGGGVFATGIFHNPFDWENPKGRLVVMELPAGKYEMYRWQAFHGNITYTSKDFSMPFVVEEGRVNYIGNFFINIDESAGKSRFERYDMSKRDIPLLLQRYKNITESQIMKSVVQ